VVMRYSRRAVNLGPRKKRAGWCVADEFDAPCSLWKWPVFSTVQRVSVRRRGRGGWTPATRIVP